ncbi:MAG: hypothetical protein V4603_07970, partial [Pseudomonadota bacterium]
MQKSRKQQRWRLLLAFTALALNSCASQIPGTYNSYPQSLFGGLRIRLQEDNSYVLSLWSDKLDTDCEVRGKWTMVGKSNSQIRIQTQT